MSLLTTTTDVGGLLPEEWGPLIVEPVKAAATALDRRVSRIVPTINHTFHLPVVNADAAASWLSEGAEITPSDPTVAEIVITPAKVGGLTVISRELATDSSPAAAGIIGEGLARSIARKIDAAFFGNLSAPAPAGLGALLDAAVRRIAAGTSPSNLDAFAEAQSLVEQDGAAISAFVASPADALKLAKLKTATGWNTNLLGADATDATARQILGVPLLVCPNLADGVIYGLAAERNVVVIREEVSIAVSSDAYFSSDQIAVRATMRVGFGFATPKAVARIALAAS
jgi:HK97 family phage major capsid protein